MLRADLKPAKRATACSPGRVREPWVGNADLKPAKRATACSPGRVREPWVGNATPASPRSGRQPLRNRTSPRRNLFDEVQDVMEAIEKTVDHINHPAVSIDLHP